MLQLDKLFAFGMEQNVVEFGRIKMLHFSSKITIFPGNVTFLVKRNVPFLVKMLLFSLKTFHFSQEIY